MVKCRRPYDGGGTLNGYLTAGRESCLVNGRRSLFIPRDVRMPSEARRESWHTGINNVESN